MYVAGIRLSALLLLLGAHVCLADNGAAGWTFGLTCVSRGATGVGSFTASTNSGFSGSGTCARVSGLFTELTFTASSGGTLRSGPFYALHTSAVLILPPMLTTEVQPVFAVAAACPTAPSLPSLNWLFVQWGETELRDSVSNYHLMGNASYLPATTGLSITKQYAVNGATYFDGARPMQGSCAAGVYTVTGDPLLNGTVYFNASGQGVFKLATGQATFFLPQEEILADEFTGQTYRGIFFDSSSSNGINDVSHLHAIATNAAGTELLIRRISDPTTATIDTSGTAFSDVLKLTAVNTPNNGLVLATLNRNGTGEVPVGCMASLSGDGMLFCSGVSLGASFPFTMALFAETPFLSVNGIGYGQVVAIDVDPARGNVWVGGEFTTYNTSVMNRIAVFKADGSVNTGFTSGTGFDTGVSKITVDPATGKAYVGGAFTTYQGVSAPKVVRLNPDGSRDTAFPSHVPNNSVGSIAMAADDKVYVGGSYTALGATVQKYLARFDSDGTLDTTFVPAAAINGMVRHLAYDSVADRLYVQGDMATSFQRLTSTGAVDTTFTYTGPNATYLSDMKFDPGTGKVYVCGNFPAANSVVRLTAGGAVDTTFAHSGSKQCQDIALDGSGDIYAVFGTAPKIGRIDNDGAQDTAFAAGTGLEGNQGSPFAVAYDTVTNRVWTGGRFSSYKGVGINRLARISPTGGLDGLLPTGSGFDYTVGDFAYDPATKHTYVAGAFGFHNGTEHPSIVRLKANGRRDRSFDIGTGFDDYGTVVEFDPDSGKSYVGGRFTSYNGTSAGRVARLHANGSLDTSFVQGAGFDNAVLAMRYDATNDKLYVGGTFTTYGGASAVRIARLNDNGALDTTFATGSGFGGTVSDIALDIPNGLVYVVGYFTTYKGVTQRHVVRLFLDGSVDTSFALTGAGFDQGVNDIVLVPSQNFLFVSGSFTTYASVSANRILRLTTTGARDTAFNIGTGINGSGDTVQALAYDAVHNELYVGGLLTSYAGNTVRNLIRIGSTGALDGSFDVNTELDAGVSGLLWEPGEELLYVGGDFASYRHVMVDRAMRLDRTGALR